MITLNGLKVRKDSIKEVIVDGSICYALTDDFIKIALDNDELLLVYKEAPKATIDERIKLMFSAYDRTEEDNEILNN